MQTLHTLFSRLTRSDTARGMAATLAVLAALALVSQAGILPLSGTATPTYGPLPTSAPSSSEPANDLVSGKKSSTVSAQKRAARRASSSKPSSAATSSLPAHRSGPQLTWDGKECDNHSSERCQLKIDEFLDGDLSCLADAKCMGAARSVIHSTRCSKFNAYCTTLVLMYSIFTSIAPECNDLTSKDCASIWAYFHGSLTDAEKVCLSSFRCMDHLGALRRGDLTCYLNQNCAATVADMVKKPSCAGAAWCKKLQSLHAFVSPRVNTCAVNRSASCLSQVEKRASKPAITRTLPSCGDLIYCGFEAEHLAEDVLDGYETACFLWKPCAEALIDEELPAACAIQSTDRCKNGTRMVQFYTRAHPECVTKPFDATCRDLLEKTLNP